MIDGHRYLSSRITITDVGTFYGHTIDLQSFEEDMTSMINDTEEK